MRYKLDDVYIDDNGDMQGPKLITNMLEDIGAGICNAQKLDEAIKTDGKFRMDKVKRYEPKTIIPNIIQGELLKSNYQDFYKWEHDTSFISDGVLIEIVKYDSLTGDWCEVRMNGEKKYLTKRGLLEWWEDRNNKPIKEGQLTFL